MLLTEASTRRRAVAVGWPTAVPVGAITASAVFPITAINGKDSSRPPRPAVAFQSAAVTTALA